MNLDVLCITCRQYRQPAAAALIGPFQLLHAQLLLRLPAAAHCTLTLQASHWLHDHHS
jgi:hypothetical protein